MKKYSLLVFLFCSLSIFSQIINDDLESFTEISFNSIPVIVKVVKPLQDPNTIKFLYDDAGNQISRQFIYIASGIFRPSNNTIPPEPIAKEKLVESDLFADILYYPNPVVSELFVKWKNSDLDFVDHIELYSLSGQKIKYISDIKNNQETTIDFQSLPSGYYNLLLVYSSGVAKDLKIIKK